jgi:hypothetical protein
MVPPELERQVRAFDVIERKRLRIIKTDREGRVLAHVRSADGDEVYRVARTAGGRWSCSCPGSCWNAGECPHRLAARWVTENGG